ncbi:MAG: glycosyltransferase [Nitrospira sp.]|nr:glycosyltransferase [Nitrospira sp.]MDH4342025.1 glycosyltransferase [Nitrospira sp.]MDH5334692.1 glycosyltransferase [Nitrospira sp.]
MSYLAQNLEGLRERYPALVQTTQENRGGLLTVVPSREGSPSATHEGRWVHSGYDPRKEAQAWAEAQLLEWKAGELAVVLGVGLLYHVEALVALKPEGAMLTVVVPNIAEFNDAASTRPMEVWINRVDWVWGAPGGMAEQLATRSMPLRFMTYGSAARLHADVHRDLEAELRRIVAAKQSGRLHVAVVGPIYGGSLPIARYTVTALESLGHRVSWLDQSPHRASYDLFASGREPRHRATMQSRFADLLSLSVVTNLAEDPPDLVLALAQAPLNLAVLEHLRKKKFLTAMWFVENYRHLTYWQQLAGGYDYWFVIQQASCIDALTRAGARQVHYLPMATDPALHRPLGLTEAEQAEYGADVSFVGAGYANRRTLLPGWLSKDWSFKLWGNEWEGADGLTSLLQRGGTRIDTETCIKVFNATAVNLNLHSCAGDGLDPEADFINPRTFELAACGAFQLVDERSLFPDLFALDEMVRFRSVAEVPSLIRTWLADSSGRRTIAAAARRRVLAQHTYAHRMSELLAAIGMHQPDRIGAMVRGDRNAGVLGQRADAPPELAALLRRFPSGQRVELKDVAAQIKAKGAGRELAREELLILMLDSYRAETRDLV